MVRLDDDGVGSDAPRARHRHRRVHAHGARLVGRREDDAALATADDDRLAAELGTGDELDGCVEGIHVDVEDRAAGVIGAQAGGPRDTAQLTATHARLLMSGSSWAHPRAYHPLLPGLECHSFDGAPCRSVPCRSVLAGLMSA